MAKLLSRPTAPARTELLHLPYYCFDLELSGSPINTLVRIAVDGLAGEVVFFVTTDLATALPTDLKNCDFELSAAAARKVVLDQYKRMLLEHGLRNRTSTTVRNASEAQEMLYPFWVAYFRKGDVYNFKTLDAVSGEIQGVRMRKVFLRAFRQLDGH